MSGLQSSHFILRSRAGGTQRCVSRRSTRSLPCLRLQRRRATGAQGLAWAATVRSANWAADPELSLATLARQLGTNTGHLSRALNEGLGLGFSAFINGLRCETVAAAIDSGGDGDLLDLALDAGFSSKASFNRAFQARYGTTPSTYRRTARERTSQITNIDAEMRF